MTGEDTTPAKGDEGVVLLGETTENEDDSTDTKESVDSKTSKGASESVRGTTTQSRSISSRKDTSNSSASRTYDKSSIPEGEQQDVEVLSNSENTDDVRTASSDGSHLYCPVCEEIIGISPGSTIFPGDACPQCRRGYLCEESNEEL